MRKKRKKNRGILIFSFFIAIFAFYFFIPSHKNFISFHEDHNPSLSELFQQTKNKLSPINRFRNHLYSSNAILLNNTTGKILMEKKSEEKIYPASLTKIMSAIVVIEHITDLQKTIVLQPEMFHSLYAEDASMAGFQPNEKVSVMDLLYGALLPSGAEATIGLANYVSSSETEFVQLMNDKARELGMKHTHFTNATGLHDVNHYSSVRDIAKLLQYSLNNEVFRKIFTTERYSVSPTNQHPNGFTFENSMFKNIESNEFSSREIIGGKTGYTEEAGLCLASLAKKEGEEYILVTAGARGDHKTKQFNLLDALTVYNDL